jgi:hypothetical protein
MFTSGSVIWLSICFFLAHFVFQTPALISQKSRDKKHLAMVFVIFTLLLTVGLFPVAGPFAALLSIICTTLYCVNTFCLGNLYRFIQYSSHWQSLATLNASEDHLVQYQKYWDVHLFNVLYGVDLMMSALILYGVLFHTGFV